MLRKWAGKKLQNMKTIVNTIPGYRVYEYLLVLSPHEELGNKIMQVKNEFNNQYNISKNNNGRPQLALASFLQYELMEERINNRLNIVAMSYPPFKIDLKDFGSFPSHTIYINVVSKIPVQGLVKLIRSETQRLMKLNDENKPYFIMEPHLTIARKLTAGQYEKAWLEYNSKHFTGRFIADKMLLLKRPVDEKGYKVVGQFRFQNLPVSTKQGELFG
jgi:2'-5' RNA ligase